MLTSRSASRTAAVTFAVATAALLAACGSMHKPASTFSQASLPAPIQVPAGNKVAWETVGSGDITYECRAKKDMPSDFEWVFVGPDAKLMDRSGIADGVVSQSEFAALATAFANAEKRVGAA